MPEKKKLFLLLTRYTNRRQKSASEALKNRFRKYRTVLYNQGLYFLNRFFKAAASFFVSYLRSGLVTLLPFLGLALGLLTGLFSRTLDFSEKNPDLILQTLDQFSIFQLICKIKQAEIKQFSLITPLLPVFLKLLWDLRQRPFTWQHFKESFHKTFTPELLIYLAAVVCAMLISQTRPWFSNFDPSGHVLLKFQLALLTQKALLTVSKLTALRTLFILSAVYSLSDAALIHNTVRYCHTLSELLAGLGIGIFLTWGASRFARLSTNSPSQKGVIKSGT